MGAYSAGQQWAYIAKCFVGVGWVWNKFDDAGAGAGWLHGHIHEILGNGWNVTGVRG